MWPRFGEPGQDRRQAARNPIGRPAQARREDVALAGKVSVDPGDRNADGRGDLGHARLGITLGVEQHHRRLQQRFVYPGVDVEDPPGGRAVDGILPVPASSAPITADERRRSSARISSARQLDPVVDGAADHAEQPGRQHPPLRRGQGRANHHERPLNSTIDQPQLVAQRWIGLRRAGSGPATGTTRRTRGWPTSRRQRVDQSIQRLGRLGLACGVGEIGAVDQLLASASTASRNSSYLLAWCRYSAGAEIPTLAAIASMLTAW